MQLPRVVIAAVFFVIGALIAIPALLKAVSPDSEPAASATTSPSPTASSPTGQPPAQPMTASIGAASCPSRTVNVTLRNTGSKSEDFGIEKNDDSAAIPGEIRAKSTRTVAVKLREDRPTRVTVTWANKRLGTKTVKANCKHAGAAPAPTKLPHTGPDTVVWARAATGVGIILTGAVIFWYGGIWPRRRDQVFAKKN